MGRVFFPLDEELGLDGRDLTPRAQEGLAHLSTWMPFARAAQLLEDFMGVRVSRATARRITQQAGETYLAVETAEAERIEREQPPVPAGAEKQALSADGAFVPLVGGEWAEVKTLVLAEVSRNKQGEVCTRQPSYFSRMSTAETFGKLALVETHRRGLEEAAQVCAVMDGAEWLQGFVNYHRVDAVRILDFPHAAEYVSAFGQAVSQAGGKVTTDWLDEQLHRLKHEGPQALLADLRALQAKHPEVELLREHLTYLSKREGHMQYPTYQADGWPIGSGIVESANKVVVETRLKGAGMHWKRENVNAMLALRNAVCNDRWAAAWAASYTCHQQQRHQRRYNRTQQRCRHASSQFLQLWLRFCLPPGRTTMAPASLQFPATTTSTAPQEASPRQRPAATHPWKRPFSSRSRNPAHAKL